MNSESIEGAEKVQALLIFSLAEEWRQVLLSHGCIFGMHEEYGETIQFPEGTTELSCIVGKVRQPTAIASSFPMALNSVKRWTMRARGKVGSCSS